MDANDESPTPPPPHRRVWVRERSCDWWDRHNSPELPEAEFRRAFRMSRATFDFLCDALGSAVAKEDTALRAAIPVRQRVAVCVWRLATGESLRLVSRRFGLGISTCHKLVVEVCTAIRVVLMQGMLAWPDPARGAEAVGRFETISGGISGVVGSMYTTHIPVTAPRENAAAYFNRRLTERNQRTSYTVTLQGVVDPDGIFTDVFIGWPGSMADEQVLENSALYQRGNGGMLGGAYWIVGGASYPLLDWLLVPYVQGNLTWVQHTFNERAAAMTAVAREAFRRLKGRWGCLRQRTEVKLQDLPLVIGACCVLHNLCEMTREEMGEELLGFPLEDYDMLSVSGVRSAGAAQARDAIAHSLFHGTAPP
ncbi:protein ANTAGONIST OF LIKE HETEROCHROMATIN PROTEIN 1-like [Zingiber officinale]|uniref:DDE Tnp4 domain-containing protein n=1 Tax=Zingiber officinale TaxID=94328 RepID=A0A8J5I1H4_ZINOF|nr:protein ANTAGONIST OF LIKE HETEROCHROMATIN PROTEIN 1-like [Zingiber officinale]KAG6539022.1 hypothetical protein ZIOFF_004174 [Zingiber officinale]